MSQVVTTYRKYPILVLGFNIQRWETIGGRDFYFQALKNKLLFWLKDQKAFDPNTVSTVDVGPTHLQKQSKYGFLITWPLCFHVWYQFKPQEEGQPGTETVFYWRIGWARWEAGRGVYIVPTWFLGGHWD